jgi:predicted ATPase
MILTHVKLKNWKNFQVVDLDLSERMFIVGPNASGKSNFLDAFRFLRDIAKGTGGGLQKAIEDRGGFSTIRCYGARRNPNLEIEVKLSPAPGKPANITYSLGLTQETSGHRRPIIKYEKVVKDRKVLLSRPELDEKKDPELLTETYLEQTSRNREFSEVAVFFNSFCYLHLVPQLLRHPESFNGNSISEDPYGRRFLEHLAEVPDKTRIKRLKKIEKALRIVAPTLKELAFDRDGKGTPHLYARHVHWRPNAGKQSEIQFSDGTLRFIGLVWSLLERNSLLLLEEPELSLNSEIVKQIPAILFSLANKQKCQVILSTHSWDLLSDKGIGAHEVIVLRPGQERTDAMPLKKDKESVVLLKGGLSVAEVAVPLATPADAIQLSLRLYEDDEENGK